MLKAFDLHNPFFRPVWIRVLVVAICLGWAMFELVSGEPFWAVLFGALGVYAVWQFFVVPFPEDDGADPKD